jgi:hypothetical protein
MVDVEARIAELVARHRDELVDLVDLELDRALDAIVAERIAARNGVARPVDAAHDETASEVLPVGSTLAERTVRPVTTGGLPLKAAPTASLCVDCGTRAPAPGRHVCNRCRSRRRRDRHAEAAPAEPPRTGA